MLAQDVVSWADGGGKVYAAPRPTIGREIVARLMIGLSKQALKGGYSFEIGQFNGQPGLIFKKDGHAYTVMLLLGAGMLAMFYLLTLYMQIVRGYAALHTGLAYLPVIAGAGSGLVVAAVFFAVGAVVAVATVRTRIAGPEVTMS